MKSHLQQYTPRNHILTVTIIRQRTITESQQDTPNLVYIRVILHMVCILSQAVLMSQQNTPNPFLMTTATLTIPTLRIMQKAIPNPHTAETMDIHIVPHQRRKYYILNPRLILLNKYHTNMQITRIMTNQSHPTVSRHL